MKKVSLELVSVLITGLGLLLLSTTQVSAQPLVTDGANISINPVEPLPANGTVSVSTEGVTDTDMNVIPPEGVTVIMSNDTVTVTNQEVDIATAEEAEEDEEDEEDEDGGGQGLPLPG
jgi:TATA-binding protein-associated factor Taf7